MTDTENQEKYEYISDSSDAPDNIEEYKDVVEAEMLPSLIRLNDIVTVVHSELLRDRKPSTDDLLRFADVGVDMQYIEPQSMAKKSNTQNIE